MVNDQFEGPEIIPEKVMVSQASGSVAPERRSRDHVPSSAMVRTWLTAVGAELVQLIVIVPVAILLVAPLASCAW